MEHNQMLPLCGKLSLLVVSWLPAACSSHLPGRSLQGLPAQRALPELLELDHGIHFFSVGKVTLHEHHYRPISTC